MGSKKREAVLDIWEAVCGQNRTQNRDEMISRVCRAHTMPRKDVIAALAFLEDSYCVEVFKGRTKEWWVKPTRLGRDKWKARVAKRRRHRAAP